MFVSKYNHMLLRVDENDTCEPVNIDFNKFDFTPYDDGYNFRLL